MLLPGVQETQNEKFDAIKAKVNEQLTAWANQGLSLLSKILIYKTLGFYQNIYAARIFNFNKMQHLEITSLIYKFPSNRNL